MTRGARFIADFFPAAFTVLFIGRVALKVAHSIVLINFVNSKLLIFNMPVWRNGRRTGLKILGP